MIRRIYDEDELVKLFPLFIAEGKEIGVDINRLNPDKLWRTLDVCRKQGAIFVSGDVVLEGTMVMVPIDSYWNDSFTYLNLLFYVLPEYRKSRLAVELIRASADFARAQGIEFNINVETLTDIERKDKFFARYGFMKTGGYYKLKGI